MDFTNIFISILVIVGLVILFAIGSNQSTDSFHDEDHGDVFPFKDDGSVRPDEDIDFIDHLTR